ncbi:iron(III) transport system substrate-binding protein [Rhodopseudomonas thermotolerans]|uniref:Iron(III) transport system substrate-binding protein n=2 Tax=Rhodopseudomonas TaxID=1073 RepID=A0A336JJY9_9BRAD|nr:MULTISPECIES: Fe(3+) ABC transporter substrate-binding protein [Rhodopseudomonas]RED37940.1 iron(III) transport system substrate-binding protein [Rhodopseudomonas pentothenatexigens]REG05133.1 iron(III) transport system substrate-binding protein [Rhodopseudomonas thermotolerans]SSW89965.1 iron(III) transport system substrate-binding protein [Rhodopseudomonas pentothenatexigens]
MSRLRAAALAVAAILVPFAAEAAEQVNVYTYRETKLVQPLFDAFTKDTGIAVNVISASSGLEQRIKAEGADSPADVLLTVDIGRIDDAVAAGISQPINSAVIDEIVPAQFRDPNGHWAGISMRARVIYASKDRVKQEAITYEELADPKWKGKICIRSGQHIYNNALFAAYVAKHGEAKAEEWLRGLKANLAQKPSGGDRETARDVAAGKCDLGIGNTYYWALMLKDPDKKAWADATKVILPTFEGGGTHVNLSGVLLTKNAPNKASAVKLIEWLAGEKAQQIYADANYEYPIRAGVALNPVIASYGKLKPDPLPIAKIAANRKAAATLVDKVGFDN